MVEANKHYFTPGPKLLKWITETHVNLYQQTDGVLGGAVVQFGEKGFGLFRRMNVMLLTTKGRKSGKERKVTLPYFQYDDDLIAIASNAASEKNPDWYVNLVANPVVTVQIQAAKLKMVAKPLEGEAYERMWKRHTDSWPRWNVYAERTSRRIPIVVFKPA